ncbi:MAG: Crp/Fnr family transcriptional regulator [Acidobacteriota bacterium]|nr:Crp/Fnr family transcriptional regulator [Acidobacteriota bacterium]
MTIKKLVTNEPNNKNGFAYKTSLSKLPAGGRELLSRSRRALVGGRLLKRRGGQPQTQQDIAPIRKSFSNQLLSSLSDSDYSRLSPYLETVTLASGEELNKPGESINYVYFPEDVTVSQFQGFADGSTAEIIMVGNEGMVGLNAVFGSTPSPFWTQAMTGGKVFRIKTSVLKEEFLHNPSLQFLLLNYANTYIAQISQRVSCNIRHVAEARFCTWLLMLQDRTDDECLRLTQEQIAVCLGINRPTVTNLAQSLKESGIIDYVRGCIKILDRARLEKSACECYQATKEYMQSAAVVH